MRRTEFFHERKASSFHESEILEAGSLLPNFSKVPNVVPEPWPLRLPTPELGLHVSLMGRTLRFEKKNPFSEFSFSS